MTAVVFLGPSMPVSDAMSLLAADYRPPAECGDVYLAVREGASAVGLVDGYFHRRPSVRHKEILWALEQGVPVLGAASMGALRAVELAPFGMRGIGAIFEAFQDGRLEDDDEVAVAHAGADHGYLPTSEPLVNIRATLASAMADRVVSRATADAVESAAKTAHYVDRSFQHAIEACAGRAYAAELEALRTWLPVRYVDQKRLDTQALLRELAGAPVRPATNHGAAVPRFRATEWWDRLVAELEKTAVILARASASRRAEAGTTHPVLAELRTDPDACRRARSAALLRLLLLREGQRRVELGETGINEAVRSFLAARHLTGEELLAAWLTEHELAPQQMVALAADEARMCAVLPQLEQEADAVLLDQLRASGEYGTLRRQAQTRTEVPSAGDLDAME